MSDLVYGERRAGDALTAAQQAALAVVKQGRNVEDAAAAAGVSRMTVYRWIKSDPFFRAAYNAWEEAARQSARARLVTVLDRELDKVMCCVESDSKLAFKVVAAMGAFAADRPLQTDPDRLRQEMELEEREQDRQIKRRLKRLSRGRTRIVSSVPAQIEKEPPQEDRTADAPDEGSAAAAPSDVTENARTEKTAPAQSGAIVSPGDENGDGSVQPALMLIDTIISWHQASASKADAGVLTQPNVPPAQMMEAKSDRPEAAEAPAGTNTGNGPPAFQAGVAGPAAVAVPPVQAALAPAPPSSTAVNGRCYKNAIVTSDDPDADPRSPWHDAAYSVY